MMCCSRKVERCSNGRKGNNKGAHSGGVAEFRVHTPLRVALHILLIFVALVCLVRLLHRGDIGIGRRFSDRQKKNKLAPSRVPFKKVEGVAAPKKIESIYAGGSSTFAMDADGKAWFWGPNNYNQSGRPNATDKSEGQAKS